LSISDLESGASGNNTGAANEATEKPRRPNVWYPVHFDGDPFLSLPIDWVCPKTDPVDVARKAFRDAFKKALPHYSSHIEDVDFSGMNEAEKAFIICLDYYFWETDWFDLLSWDLEAWEEKLGLGDNVLPPFDELIEAIDKHCGTLDWKEIFYHQEGQDEAMERLRNRYESRRERRLEYLAEHPEEAA